MKPVLVFDFDGTVCLGEAPVERYCEEVASRLPADAAADVRGAYASYVAGDGVAPDGYFAVADALAGRLSPEDLSAAYLASRAWLAEHPASVSLPDGLSDFLLSCHGRGARLILLTNSPRHGSQHVLEAHGVANLFDEIRGDARKPTNWPRHLADFLDGAAPATLMSVGDVWRNDIAPPADAGCATGYIDPRGLGGAATLTAATLPALYPELLAWIDTVRDA